MRFFSMDAAKETKFGTKVAWGDDDARTPNARIAQSNRVIPHSTIKNKLTLRNVIECCNNTHQGASRTGKQTIRTRLPRVAVLASTVLYHIDKICKISVRNLGYTFPHEIQRPQNHFLDNFAT